MEKLIPYIPLLMKGTFVTVSLAVCALFLATLLGALGAVGRVAGGRVGSGAVLIYTSLVRGVPELVLILLIYFGGQRALNQIGGTLGLEYIDLSKFWAGVIAIGFIYGAYLVETFRGAYLTIPRGQGEAAAALGLRPFVVFRLVMVPQLIRFALPGYANVWQVLVKATAVVSIIGLQDLVGLANDAGKSVREPFTFLAFALLIYLCITWVSTQIFEWLTRRYAEKTHAN
ncbi:ABC transporter permease [Algicella marina]|uniref:ABC transporter permease subunit n=1 Tax=Algicella marina TaxID=2683284 RepID=A0A6P1SUU5_9RHOB|nr:ABC transporter permease subunit [Algicella marina]QHQ34464.1 ABC transporter permease subunit [Algicella marina]